MSHLNPVNSPGTIYVHEEYTEEVRVKFIISVMIESNKANISEVPDTEE